MNLRRYAIRPTPYALLLLLLAPAPAPAANVLPNSSFELGMCNWTWQTTDADAFHWRPVVEWEDMIPDVREEGAWHGKRCVRLDLAERFRMFIRSPWVRLPADQPRTFSIYLKRDPADTGGIGKEVELRFEPAPGAGAAALTGRVRLPAEWQRFTLTQPAPAQAEAVRVGLRADGPMKFLFDAAQLESGAQATAFAPRAPVEVAITAASSDHWFVSGETPTLVVAAADYDPKTVEPRKIRLTARNFDQREVVGRELALNTASNRFAVTLTPFNVREVGNFVAGAELAGQPAVRDETSINVVRPVVMRPPARTSPFGATVRFRRADFDLAEKSGARWLRLPLVTQWFVVEPRRDQWQWFDEALRAVWRRGLEVLGALDASAYWENDKDDRGARPEEWAAYVTQTVRRYRNWIHAWEVWNEPDQPGLLAGATQDETLRNYADLLRRTHAAAREADPHCLIVGGALGDAKLAPKLVQLGALNAMDALSIHARSVSATEDFETQKPPLVETIGAVYAAMRAQGGLKPIWITAAGLRNVGSGFRDAAGGAPARPADRQVPPRHAAGFIVRQYALAMSLGVEKLFYDIVAAPTGSEEETTGFYGDDTAPSMLAVAYATASGLLDAATFLKRHDVGPYSRALEFRRPGDSGRLLVAWAVNPTPAAPDAEFVTEIDLPGDWSSPEVRAMDVMGNILPPTGPKARLTQVPTLFVAAR